jgi:hypothetical protein
MEERVGEAFELGEKLTVLGGKLGRGMPAPLFYIGLVRLCGRYDAPNSIIRL